MKIIFFGTPEFAVRSLDRLIEAKHEIVCVYCQPPRAAGRGKKIKCSPVHLRANELNLLVRHPTTFDHVDSIKDLVDLNADIGIVVAYGLLLPQKILDSPKLGCLNIHASLLPRWRGAAPIQRAIMAGDKKTGISIMKMDAGLDTGNIFIQSEIFIGQSETTGELHDRLAVLGADTILKVIRYRKTLVETPQPTRGITYAKKILKTETAIDWTRSAVEIERLIRGMFPNPGAWTKINDDRIKILGCKIKEINDVPGKHLGSFIIACGEGAISVTQIQKPGKRITSADEFLRGNKLPEILI